MKKKSYLKWSWIFFISFMILSIINIKFALLGFLCMGIPIYFALNGQGKIHCSHYCPRGSFLSKFLNKISFNNTMPKILKTKLVKNILLTFMGLSFLIGLISTKGELIAISYLLFRMMFVSSIIGVLLGFIYKPRSWCQVCPMGHATSLIKTYQDKKANKNTTLTKIS
ncbi:4Fe-4S binding protein [Peptostreptococcaceae bacterium AGR-M142]